MPQLRCRNFSFNFSFNRIEFVEKVQEMKLYTKHCRRDALSEKGVTVLSKNTHHEIPIFMHSVASLSKASFSWCERELKKNGLNRMTHNTKKYNFGK